MTNADGQFDIDAIVRRVIDALAQAGHDVSPAKSATATDACAATLSNETKTLPPGETAIRDRVITLATLEGRLDGLKKLYVMPSAVVTPAVVDELRERGVELVRCEKLSPSNASSEEGEPAALIACMAPTIDVAQLRKTLGNEGRAAAWEDFDCLIEAVDSAAEAVHRTRLGVVLTRHASAAICLANRLPGVRAIQADCPERARREAEGLGANVIVVDPRGKSQYAVRKLIADFLSGGVRPCPESLRSRLG